MNGNRKIEDWAILCTNVFYYHLMFQNSRPSKKWGRKMPSGLRPHFWITWPEIEKTGDWTVVWTNVWYHFVKFQNSWLRNKGGDTKIVNVNRRTDEHLDPFSKVISEKRHNRTKLNSSPKTDRSFAFWILTSKSFRSHDRMPCMSRNALHSGTGVSPANCKIKTK